MGSVSFSVWLYDAFCGGVDFNLPGNGGPECSSFLSLKRRAVETFAYVLFNILVFIIASKRCKLTLKLPQNPPKERLGKKLVLVTVCLVFGIEFGYKLSTKQIIYLLNPCHVLTMTQIVLLCLPENSKLTVTIFRYVLVEALFVLSAHKTASEISYRVDEKWVGNLAKPETKIAQLSWCHMHMLSGAFLAIIFPVVNSRLLPGEVMTYWGQHILIFVVVPSYLLYIGGSYTTEPFGDFSWSAIVSAIFCFYMFLFLQPLALVSQVNLNNMICPAISDPFYGENYRVCAMVHQQILVLTFGKLYSFIVNAVLSQFQRKSTRSKSN